LLGTQIADLLISYLSPLINTACYLALLFYALPMLYKTCLPLLHKTCLPLHVLKLSVPSISLPGRNFFSPYVPGSKLAATPVSILSALFKLPRVRLLPTNTHPICTRADVPKNTYELVAPTVTPKPTCLLNIIISLVNFAFCHTQHNRTVYT
jgi:hypothetical protein